MQDPACSIQAGSLCAAESSECLFSLEVTALSFSLAACDLIVLEAFQLLSDPLP